MSQVEILLVQIVVFSIFSFERSIIVPMLIANAMQDVAATERGSMNRILNAAPLIGVAVGSLVGEIAYAADKSYLLNASISAVLLAVAAGIVAFEFRRAQPA